MKVAFISSNPSKFAECKAILDDICKLKNITNIELVHITREVPEIQGTPSEVTRNKCLSAGKKSIYPVLIEDVSLFFEAWGTLPGAYVKYFTEMGTDKMVQMLSAFDNKNAEAVCIYGYTSGTAFSLVPKDEEEPLLFIGKQKGTIVSPKGTNGFGFDTIFKPKDEIITYAEMETYYKNSISHRRIALEAFCDWWKNIRK